MVRICFVCLGNICRSPTAEGIFRELAAREGVLVEVDSAGTGDWHVGEPPDARATRAAAARGYRLSGRARKFVPRDFARFDLILAMDGSNREALLALAPTDDARRKIHLLRSFDPNAPADANVPDPYYGEDDGFDRVISLCEAACRGLLDEIRKGLQR